MARGGTKREGPGEDIPAISPTVATGRKIRELETNCTMAMRKSYVTLYLFSFHFLK